MSGKGFGRLAGFVERHIGEDYREHFREHRLARARRPYHEDVIYGLTPPRFLYDFPSPYDAVGGKYIRQIPEPQGLRSLLGSDTLLWHGATDLGQAV